MPHTRTPRNALAALTITVAAVVAAPGIGSTQTAPPIDTTAMEIIPAIIGSAVTSAASPDAAHDELITTLTGLLMQPGVPNEVRDGAERIVSFISVAEPTAPGGPPLPTDGPPISQFLYPTIGFDCIGPGQSSIATALAVSGPAAIPVPGPRKREAAFVFTALGTGGATDHKPHDALAVSWFNIDTGRSGTAQLDNSAGINPQGPATYTAIERTGSGRVLATIHGSVTLQGPNGPITCGFAPTVGFVHVE
ncbi:hypothetical protein IEU95_02225 [Hoyosella rhizosphaerae]|uniref:Secreted protein n=1 Tax=Hoyosella rhizosphaerae TaxID=1755582 RepID=A0A916UCZ8_9ACTN|nr:hypothetical protein [Hoyosella rhizosphaerae]MBN4925631.1 hypothetical protein [Hoyosella rhizosphaerae]GGC69134.1 hypothetical protein GCM10011410_22430 [Hoyosella rhizosphaerae]